LRGTITRPEPAAVDGERPHEEARTAGSHENAGKHQEFGGRRECEEDDADDRDPHRDRHREPRPPAVDGDPERDLRAGEAKEKRAREQADPRAAQPHVLGEVRGNHADGIAQELADDVDHAHRRHQQHQAM
jgi:hypothetical protein